MTVSARVSARACGAYAAANADFKALEGSIGLVWIIREGALPSDSAAAESNPDDVSSTLLLGVRMLFP